MKFSHISRSIALAYCLSAVGAAAADSWGNPFDEVQYHIIVVKGNGEPFRPVVQRRQKPSGIWEYNIDLVKFGRKPEEQADEYKKYLRALVEHIRQSQQTRVMVFIHGGMNFVKGSVKHAAELVGDYERFRRLPDEGRPNIRAAGYPIFICWDSPPTGYLEQVAWVRAGKTEQYGRSVGRGIYAWASLPFHLLADVGRAVTRLPAEIFEFGYNDFYSIDQRSFTEFKKMNEETPYLRGEKRKKNPGEGTAAAGREDYLPIAKRIDVSNVKPVEKKSKHYLQDIGTVMLFPVRSVAMPVVDAIGVGAWNNMLRHTDTMFDRTSPESRHYHTPVEVEFEKGGTGAIAMFLATFRGLPHFADYQVTLIGHSMGAIVANRIIVSYPEFNYTNIVYMAAACSVREYQNCVIPYLRVHRQSHFYGLSLHPRREAGELAISLRNIGIDIAPRGSLLVWIDNIFGNPPSEDQRRFGIFQTAVLASHNIPLEVRGQVTLKCFEFGDEKAHGGIIESPQHHGDFSRAPYWDSSFWKIKPPEPTKAADDSGSSGPNRTASTP
jgi:hypothetical protein